jgi:hypothetical protein
MKDSRLVAASAGCIANQCARQSGTTEMCRVNVTCCPQVCRKWKCYMFSLFVMYVCVTVSYFLYQYWTLFFIYFLISLLHTYKYMQSCKNM